MNLDTNSPTWLVVRHYCRTRMRELEREVISRPITAPDQLETERMRGEWQGLTRLLNHLQPEAENETLDRPDLEEESFEP